MDFLNKILQTDCLTGLRKLPGESINCCVTSPPYWALRDYGVPGQIGLEKSPDEYITKMVEVFREVKRVLREDGTLWLNIGDTYSGSYKGKKDKSIHLQDTNKGSRENVNIPFFYSDVYKPKDLIGIPWMLAFALRADGWYLRQDIIWHKPNPMPESVNDRCTKAHEYIFLLTKSRKYYYDADAIKEPASNNTHARRARVNGNNKSIPDDKKNGIRPRKAQKPPAGWDMSKGSHDKMVGNYPKVKDNVSFDLALQQMPDFRNKRSVWSVSPEAFSEAHFATYPQKLIVDCIKAGCPGNGIVLDPFMGAGTTALVAQKLNRNYIGFELSEEYLAIANRRLYKELGMYL